MVMNLLLCIFQYRDKHRSRNKKSSAIGVIDGDQDQIDAPGKKGKKKLVYGVNNTKYYSSNTSKQCVESLKMAGKVEQFEARENIFEDNRPALMKLIRLFNFNYQVTAFTTSYSPYRDSAKRIDKVCDGFLRHTKHLENQFYYCTDTNISMRIRSTLEGHLGTDEKLGLEILNRLLFRKSGRIAD